MNRIDSFRGLRAIAFMAIFISHANLGPYGGLGAWGVSVFFCLSGFLMAYNYFPKQSSPRFGLKFPFDKIKKLYPLHIITMLAMLVFLLYKNAAVRPLIYSLISHSLLFQIWLPIPDIYSNLNNISWYLCVCLFHYFCFPLILRCVKKYLKSKSSIICSLVILFVLQIVISGFSVRLAECYNNQNIIKWLTYFFPISRTLDFIIGCCTGVLFLYTETKENHKVSLTWSYIQTKFRTVFADKKT